MLLSLRKMRIDVFLTEKGYAQSRTEAQGLVKSGNVKYLNKIITKPSFDIPCDATEISVDRSAIKYVSRGGFKLEGALEHFEIKVDGRLALDVGASSGGFTDCLLKNGASHVISVDSGSGQMHQSLRDDARVTVIENYNARYMVSEDFEYTPNLAVMDVSFISATYIIPSVYNVLASGGDFVCLIKPQFEVGRSALGKGGIVKDDNARLKAVKKVCDFAQVQGFSVIGVTRSQILGGDGNIEFVAHFKKNIQK